MATQCITAALQQKNYADVTLLVYKEVTRRRVLHGTDVAVAVEEIYSECKQDYAQRSSDQDLFDALWTGVEELIHCVFE
jgi:hypothetical protein